MTTTTMTLHTLSSLLSNPLAAGWTFSLRVRRVVGSTMMMMMMMVIHDVIDRICEGSLSHICLFRLGARFHMRCDTARKPGTGTGFPIARDV
jgi:hypothetical protein